MRRLFLVLCLSVFLISNSVSCSEFFTLDEQEIRLLGRSNDFSESSLNPGNILNLEEQYMKSKYLLSFSGQLNEAMSFYLNPRLVMNTTKSGATSDASFKEIYSTINPSSKLYIDIGKKDISWGTAYAWNIINIFDDQNRFIRESAQYQTVLHSQYYVNHYLSLTHASFLESNDYGLKLQSSVKNIDIDLVFLNQQDKEKIGIDFSTVIGDSLEVHAELLGQSGSDAFYPESPTQNVFTWQQLNDNTDIYSKFILGFQYTTLSNTNIVIEYFYNGLGLNNAEFELMESGLEHALSNNNYQSNSVASAFLLNASSYYNFSQFRKNYLFFRISNDSLLDKVGLECNSYYAIDDKGFLAVPSISYKLSNAMLMTTKGFLSFGDKSTEFKRFYDKYVSVELSMLF